MIGPSVRATNQVTRRPTALDLYAGAGGLSLGLEQAGFDVIAAAEVDPVHALVHRFNFPRSAVVCRDIGTLDAETLIGAIQAGWSLQHPDVPFPGTVDAVVGGPPCQGFSVGGVRRADDERNLQLLNFVGVVEFLRPRLVLLENVAGLLEDRFSEVRQVVTSRLQRLGYRMSGHEYPVNAADFGVPQNRRRVLVFGVLDGQEPLTLESDRARVTVGEALEGLPNLSSYRSLLRSDAALLKEKDLALRLQTAAPYARRLAGLSRAADDYSYEREWDSSWLTNSRRTVHTPATRRRFERTLPGSVEPGSRLYRLSESGLSRTLRAGSGPDHGSHTSPRPIHPTLSRAITVREAARIHGFPDWFRFHTTNWHGQRQIGNSVPPPLARAAGRALIGALGLSPSKPTETLALGDPIWLRQSPQGAMAILADLKGLDEPGSSCTGT